MSSQPIALGASIAEKALSDANFMAQMPEFRVLGPKLQTMRTNLLSLRGCSSCQRRRVVKALFSEFQAIVHALSPDGLIRFKAYLGTEALMMNVVDPQTNAVKTVIL